MMNEWSHEMPTCMSNRPAVQLNEEHVVTAQLPAANALYSQNPGVSYAS